MKFNLTAEPRQGEIFVFGKYRFDVYAAHQLIVTGAINAPVIKLSTKAYKDALRIPLNRDKPWTDKAQGLGFFIGLDWKHLSTLNDESIKTPGIMAQTPDGDILIDGNHRLSYAYMKGIEHFNVQKIPKAHIKKILVGTKENIKFKSELKKSTRPVSITAFLSGDVEREFTLGKVNYNQLKGIGNVSDSANIKYMGIAVIMTPDQFFSLVTPRDFSETSSLKGIKAAIKMGKPIGSPFISINFEPLRAKKPKPAIVTDHEGRTRMQAIKELYGNIPVLVHIFPRGGERARHLTPDLISSIRKSLIPQKKKSAIEGPHFDRKAFHIDKWIELDNNFTNLTTGEQAQAALSRLMVRASTSDINKKYQQDLMKRIRTAIMPLNFFSGDLHYIEKFETLLQDINKRQTSIVSRPPPVEPLT